MSSNADVGLLSPVWAGTEAERLTSDVAVAQAMVRFESALSRSLAEHGIAPAPERSFGDLDVRALALEAVSSGNPTLAVIGRLRASDALLAVGDDDGGRWVHHGATSQDVVDTALMLVATSVLQGVDGDLVQLANRLAALVVEHRDTVCVARTLTQQAMPTTLGFRVAGWLSGVHDALELARGCLPLPVSLGGPVGTAAAFGATGPAVVDSVAAHLGLEAPVGSWHTRRTPVLRLATALAAVGEACGRMSADVLLMAQTEVGEVSDGSGGTSSSMSHKQNPTRSVLVASATHQLPFLLASLVASSTGASERPAGAWHAEWQPLRTMLRLSGAVAERSLAMSLELSFDLVALDRNLGTLLSALDHEPGWALDQTAHVGVWVDRVLARHEEILG